MKNTIIKVVLFIVIIVLAYFVVESFMKTVRFDKEQRRRSDVVIQNLKDIRAAQFTFKAINGIYAHNFDTLIDFLETGEIPVVKIIPDPEDTTFTKTINDTIAFVLVKDSLFKHKGPNFKIKDLAFIPFSDGEEFIMSAGEIEKGKVKVNVFEAIARKEIYLKGLDEELVSRESVMDLRVGSMTEPSTDGNWE